MEPPKDLYSLPYDLQKEYALLLSPEDLLNLCKSSTRLKAICKDPYFWKAKLGKDFPLLYLFGDLESLEDLEPETYKLYYQFYYWSKKYEEAERLTGTVTYYDTEDPNMMKQEKAVLNVEKILEELPEDERTIALNVTNDFFWEEDADHIYTAELSIILGFPVYEGNIIILEHDYSEPNAIYIYKKNNKLKHVRFSYTGCVEGLPKILKSKYTPEEFIGIYGEDFWRECSDEEEKEED
jgi:hypothetical protein